MSAFDMKDEEILQRILEKERKALEERERARFGKEAEALLMVRLGFPAMALFLLITGAVVTRSYWPIIPAAPIIIYFCLYGRRWLREADVLIRKADGLTDKEAQQ